MRTFTLKHKYQILKRRFSEGTEFVDLLRHVALKIPNKLEALLYLFYGKIANQI